MSLQTHHGLAGTSFSAARAEHLDLRKSLRSSSVNHGHFRSDFKSAATQHFPKYSKHEAFRAKGYMDPKLAEDLRSVHYQLGCDSQKTVPYKWYETESERCSKSHWDPLRKWDGGKWAG